MHTRAIMAEIYGENAMKRLLLSLLFIPIVAYSAPMPQPKTCHEFHILAEAIMTLRQARVPMPEVIEAAGNNEGLIYLVEQAYDEIPYMPGELQDRAITRFAEKIYKACYFLYGTGP